jgi:hypothetical protein
MDLKHVGAVVAVLSVVVWTDFVAGVRRAADGCHESVVGSGFGSWMWGGIGGSVGVSGGGCSGGTCRSSGCLPGMGAGRGGLSGDGSAESLLKVSLVHFIGQLPDGIAQR